jgi:hypothetical protein
MSKDSKMALIGFGAFLMLLFAGGFYEQQLESEHPEKITTTNNTEHLQNSRGGEENCQMAIKETEEFPSTVDFESDGIADRYLAQIWPSLSGTQAERQYGDKAGYKITVDYSAKNHFGARLPYRMTCYSEDSGEVVSYKRANR